MGNITVAKNIKITPELNDWLESEAKKKLTSVSSIIRQLILDAITRGKVEMFECPECGEEFPVDQMRCDPEDGCDCHNVYPEDEFDR